MNFALCQIFPRDGDADSVCYLDVTVCKFMSMNDKLVLNKIELLDRNEEIPLQELEVSFHINANNILNLTSLPRTFLIDMAQNLLQAYHLCTTCIVVDTEFQRIGVDYISIEIRNVSNYSRFIVTEETKITVANISLANYDKDRNFVCSDVPTFNTVHKQLDDLMEIAKIQKESSRSSQRMNINALVVGSVGCGKTFLIEDYLHQRICNVFRLKSSNLIKQYPGEAEMELRHFFKSVTFFNDNLFPLLPTGMNVILVEDLHLLCPHTKSKVNNSETSTNAMRLLTQFLSLLDELGQSKRGILCLATTHNAENLDDLVKRPGRFDQEIPLSALTIEDRRLILEKLFNASLPDNSFPMHLLDWISKQTQGYVLADLALFVRNVTHLILTRSNISHEWIAEECLKKSKPVSVRETDVSVCKTKERFSNIGGMEQLKKILDVTVLAGLKQEKSFRRFGLTMPKGVLLYGPPGCAKTTIAKCLATEANMTFIATSGAEVYSPYVGCAEKFIAKMFDTARKNSPCLIFLDEIDSLIGRRAVNGSSGDVQIRILSTILTEMDGIVGSTDGFNSNNHIIVVAATNRPDMVDDALIRPGRFDKLIHVPAPDYESRRSILILYQQKMPFAKDVDINDIAKLTQNFSGADICNLCNEAAINAFQRDFNTSEIKHEDFLRVMKTSLKSSLSQSQIDWYYEFENKFQR
ncbi:ATPase family gene 2 protein homolog B [Musca vetustissima]|uniref:ATPase family gene 2 protein homolog B n=1 Tax=Musca vetustissima TaxID=27455 RepID=UPI002AB6F38B|nr:ATPase family gene 2 protein homolog B [Musca vetustissima]